MKAKTRNYGVCALVAAVLLAMAMLVIGCPAEPVTEGGYKPPEGMGAVRLSLNKTIQRTILPDDIKDINGFAMLGVEFLADDSNSNPGIGLKEQFFSTAADVMGETFTLEFGDYIIKVIGYLVVGKDGEEPGDPYIPPEKPAAIGEVKLTIDDEDLFTESITLYAITEPDATEKGYFSWAIDVSGISVDITTAEMRIAAISDPDVFVEEIDLTDNWTSADPIELAVGFYFVFFELEVKGGDKPALFRHVLHIYQNQESKFTYEFTDEYFIITFTRVATAEITIDYEPPEDLLPLLESDQDGGTALIEDATVTVTLGETVTITVTNASAFADDSIEWYCNGETSTGASFVFDTTEDPFKEVKLYDLSVLAIGDEDDKPYGTYIHIQVVEDDGP
jgi:hypothetical protein